MEDLTGYGAVAVANEFLRRARESHRVLSATQVHELVYCAQGWHLVLTERPLISGPVAAHRGGVFIPDLRVAGCWGAEPVQGLIHEVSNDALFPRLDASSPVQLTIDHVWEDYGPLSRYELTRFTLTEKGPWDQTWNTDARRDSFLIPNRLLRGWFGQVQVWRAAAENVSLAVDRVRAAPAVPLPLQPVAVAATVLTPAPVPAQTAAPAPANDPLSADRLRVREIRHHGTGSLAHAH